MITKIATYEIKPRKLREMTEAIIDFTRAVHVTEPGSRLYISLQDKEHKNKFIHIMAFENEGAEMMHRSATHTKKFTDVLNKHCKKETVFTEYTYIGGL